VAEPNKTPVEDNLTRLKKAVIATNNTVVEILKNNKKQVEKLNKLHDKFNTDKPPKTAKALGNDINNLHEDEKKLLYILQHDGLSALHTIETYEKAAEVVKKVGEKIDENAIAQMLVGLDFESIYSDNPMIKEHKKQIVGASDAILNRYLDLLGNNRYDTRCGELILNIMGMFSIKEFNSKFAFNGVGSDDESSNYSRGKTIKCPYAITEGKRFKRILQKKPQFSADIVVGRMFNGTEAYVEVIAAKPDVAVDIGYKAKKKIVIKTCEGTSVNIGIELNGGTIEIENLVLNNVDFTKKELTVKIGSVDPKTKGKIYIKNLRINGKDGTREQIASILEKSSVTTKKSRKDLKVYLGPAKEQMTSPIKSITGKITPPESVVKKSAEAPSLEIFNIPADTEFEGKANIKFKAVAEDKEDATKTKKITYVWTLMEPQGETVQVSTKKEYSGKFNGDEKPGMYTVTCTVTTATARTNSQSVSITVNSSKTEVPEDKTVKTEDVKPPAEESDDDIFGPASGDLKDMVKKL